MDIKCNSCGAFYRDQPPRECELCACTEFTPGEDFDGFADCGRGRNAPRDCDCDACANYWSEEWHRRREDAAA